MKNKSKYTEKTSSFASNPPDWLLPIPTSKSVKTFKVLCQKRLGVTLTDAQAHEGAYSYLLIYWLGTGCSSSASRPPIS